jgi:hypothetical protein
LQSAHPFSTTVGETAAMLPLGLVGKGYQGVMAAGALPGLVEYGSVGENLLGGALGAAGGAAGQALGNFISTVVKPRAAQALQAPEIQAIVTKAKELGYNLLPSQLTGKTWQKNLEAALQQNPATSTRMQGIVEGNQQVTDRVVREALDRAGGYIDQPSAGAAAVQGLNAGLAREKGIIDRAYKDVLAGRAVDLEAVRPALEAIRAKQGLLPEESQASDAVKALTGLLGSPNYRPKQAQAFVKAGVDNSRDELEIAVRKMGGVNPDVQEIGSLAKNMPFPASPRAGPVFSRKGLDPDVMAGQLRDLGYDVQSGSDLADKLLESYSGQASHFSHAFDHAAAQAAEDPLASSINRLVERLDVKNAPRPASPGFIRERGRVSGETAQDMRSGYTDKSQRAFDKSDSNAGQAFAEMRGTIDTAIEKAVPDNLKGQFASINERYGLGLAVKLLPKKDQQVLLSQIYRGAGSEDEFMHFVGMSSDKEFKEVARGFLSKVTDAAKGKDGRTNAAMLGREVERLDPLALKILGGDAGQTLRDVGEVGRNVLPELGNSHTANRLLFQTLISGGGIVAGGAGGQSAGGDGAGWLGAAAGAALAPKAVQRLYLSDLAKQFLTSAPKGYAGLLGGRDIPPQVLEYLTRVLAAGGSGGALSTQP